MRRTRVKFCGFTRQDDVKVAVDLGVDAIGLIATPRSRRCVSLDQAVGLREAIPALVSCVLLVMDPDPDELNLWLERLQPDLIQFHGSEIPAFCSQFGRPWLKALSGAGEVDLLRSAAMYGRARGLVLDAHAPGGAGGTGQRFDWSRIPVELRATCILSGGLDAARAAAAITQIGPYALDVASGVESAPGIKCAQRMRAFLQAVGETDRQQFRSASHADPSGHEP